MIAQWHAIPKRLSIIAVRQHSISHIRSHYHVQHGPLSKFHLHRSPDTFTQVRKQDTRNLSYLATCIRIWFNYKCIHVNGTAPLQDYQVNMCTPMSFSGRAPAREEGWAHLVGARRRQSARLRPRPGLLTYGGVASQSSPRERERDTNTGSPLTATRQGHRRAPSPSTTTLPSFRWLHSHCSPPSLAHSPRLRHRSRPPEL